MRVAWIAAALMTTIAAPAPGQTVAALSAGQVRVELDAHLRTRIVAILGSEETVVGPFSASESVSAGATEIDDFAFEGRSEERIEDRLGAGRRLTVTGRSKNPSIGKARARAMIPAEAQRSRHEASTSQHAVASKPEAAAASAASTIVCVTIEPAKPSGAIARTVRAQRNSCRQRHARDGSARRFSTI